jgi:hypothetical protein
VQKFGQKFRFKGPWDATGKIVKQRILNNELQNLRCANAWDCYVKLREQLTKDGTEDHISKLLEYEQNSDVNVLKIQHSPFNVPLLVIALRIKVNMMV